MKKRGQKKGMLRTPTTKRTRKRDLRAEAAEAEAEAEAEAAAAAWALPVTTAAAWEFLACFDG